MFHNEMISMERLYYGGNTSSGAAVNSFKLGISWNTKSISLEMLESWNENIYAYKFGSIAHKPIGFKS